MSVLTVFSLDFQSGFVLAFMLLLILGITQTYLQNHFVVYFQILP